MRTEQRGCRLLFLNDAPFAGIHQTVHADKHAFAARGDPDGQTSHHIVIEIDRLVPGTDGDAAASASGPFLPVARPEHETAVGLDMPFLHSRVVKRSRGRLGRRTVGHRLGRAVGGAVLARHAEVFDPEGDRFVDLEG